MTNEAKEVVYEFMTGGGLNDPETVSGFMTGNVEGDAKKFVGELLEEWSFSGDNEDLFTAMVEFINNRPDEVQ